MLTRNDLDAEKIKELSKSSLPHLRIIFLLTILNLDCDGYIEEYHANLVGMARFSLRLAPHSSGNQEKTFNEIMKMAQEVEQVPSFDASTHGDIQTYCVNFRETRSLSMK